MNVIDEILPISNNSAFQFSKALGKYEGIAGGISSGAVLAAATEIHEKKKKCIKKIALLLSHLLLRDICLHSYSMNFNMISLSEKNFEKYSRQLIMDRIGESGQKKL